MSLKTVSQNPYFFIFLAVIFFIPAFISHLGVLPVIEDESVRSLVAFEMMQRDDIITPTIGGDLYLKKPPLYNWLIILSFKLFANYSEAAIRTPMILGLVLFALSIFYFVKREFGVKMGILNALIFITLGRILFYETIYGLIDIMFSWAIYMFFMVVYILYHKKKFLLLFLAGYFICKRSTF